MLFDPRATKYLMYGTLLIWALAFFVIGFRTAHDKMAGGVEGAEHQDKRSTIVAHEDDDDDEEEDETLGAKAEEDEDEDADEEDENDGYDDDHSVEGPSRSRPGKKNSRLAVPGRRDKKTVRRASVIQ